MGDLWGNVIADINRICYKLGVHLVSAYRERCTLQGPPVVPNLPPNVPNVDRSQTLNGHQTAMFLLIVDNLEIAKRGDRPDWTSVEQEGTGVGAAARNVGESFFSLDHILAVTLSKVSEAVGGKKGRSSRSAWKKEYEQWEQEAQRRVLAIRRMSYRTTFTAASVLAIYELIEKGLQVSGGPVDASGYLMEVQAQALTLLNNL